jgi:hypothetical protein
VRFDSAGPSFIDSRRVVAIADDDGYVSVGDAAGLDAGCKRFEIRAATGQEYAKVFFHGQGKLA